MKVTQINLSLTNPDQGKLKAIARINLDDQLTLTGLRVYEGANGLFVSYPNDPNYKGEDYRQLYYPISKDLRMHIEEKVLEAYYAMERA